MTPNVSPTLVPVFATVGGNTTVTWSAPANQLVLKQPYTFTTKVKLDSNVQSGDVFPVQYATLDGGFNDMSFIYIK